MNSEEKLEIPTAPDLSDLFRNVDGKNYDFVCKVMYDFQQQQERWRNQIIDFKGECIRILNNKRKKITEQRKQLRRYQELLTMERLKNK